MLVEQPIGDVADRITILELKSARLPESRRPAAALELRTLREAWVRQCEHDLESLPGLSRLREVNAALWEVEDQLRALERANAFGPTFVSLARRVYVLNDERAVLKRGISEHTGSRLVEQKSYV